MRPKVRVQVPHPNRVRTPPCECSDPGCPVCKGKCRQQGTQTLYRGDMEDTTGTRMCDGCAGDATDSGLFYSNESLAPILVDVLINEWNPQPDGQQPDTFDAAMVAKAIRLELQVHGNYESAKQAALDNLGRDPEYYSNLIELGEEVKPKAKAKAAPEEWRAGKKVEREHTTSGRTATAIASHHLKERPDYYRELQKAGLADELKGQPPLKASMLYPPSVEPMKEPPGSLADLKMGSRRLPPAKASFYPSSGGPSSI